MFGWRAGGLTFSPADAFIPLAEPIRINAIVTHAPMWLVLLWTLDRAPKITNSSKRIAVYEFKVQVLHVAVNFTPA